MKAIHLLAGISVLSFALVGCSASGSNMTKDEVDHLKHPSKTFPKEAAEGMAHMGEMMAKQREDNAKKNIDDHGIPLAKATTAEKSAPDPMAASKPKSGG